MTTVFAIEGAITGTLGFLLSARHEFLSRRPRVNLTWEAIPREEEPSRAMMLQVLNVGLRDAHIDGPIWELNGNEFGASQGPHVWHEQPLEEQLVQGAAKKYQILVEDLQEFLAGTRQEGLRVTVKVGGKRQKFIAAHIDPTLLAHDPE